MLDYLDYWIQILPLILLLILVVGAIALHNLKQTLEERDERLRKLEDEQKKKQDERIRKLEEEVKRLKNEDRNKRTEAD